MLEETKENIHICINLFKKRLTKDKPENSELGYLQGSDRRNREKEMQKGVSFSEYTLSHNFDFQKHVNAPHLQKIKCYPQGLGSVGCLHTQGQCETRFDMCQTVLYLGFELDHPAHPKPRANGFPMSSFWHRLSQQVNRDETFQLSVFKVMR